MAGPYDAVKQAIQQAIAQFTAEIKSQLDAISNTQAGLVAVDYDIPYFTGATIDGREQWGVIIDFGVLPNATTKAYMIPQNVLNEWAMIGERWIDTGSSFFFNPTTQETYPLPHTSDLDVQGNRVSGTGVGVRLTATEIIVEAQSDRSDYSAVVVLKYLKTPT